MDAASAFLFAVAAVVVAAFWYAGVRKRAVVSDELRLQYAETQRLLADVSTQLTDLNRRTADVHRILKDAE